MKITWDSGRGLWIVGQGGSVIARSRNVEVLTRKFPAAVVDYTGCPS